MVRTKQDLPTVNANFKKALANLKASLQIVKGQNDNDAVLLDGYLMKSFVETAEDGGPVADYSVENIQEALWALRDVLSFTVAPKAPRTPNSQSILNESNKECREREAREAQEKADAAKKAEADAEVHEALRQGERMCNLPGTNAAVSHARREVAKERMWQKWEALQRQAPPAVALKLLRAYWESEAGQEELYSVRGTLRRLQS